jgi:hypothetical protein
MAIKYKVKDGKKYVWDTFANKWSFRGAVPYPIKEGEYKDKLPPAPKGARVSQIPELSEVLAAPYQAAMSGVVKVGEAISKPVGELGEKFSKGIGRAVEKQFSKREQGTMYAPTTGEKFMTEAQRIARSVVDVSPPVAQAPQEPKVQINPPMTPSPKPSISVTPPSEDEAAAARRYNVMDITRLESVLSEMNTRDKQRDLIVEKNPWLGGGFTAKLDIPSPAEAARREVGALPKPKTGYEGLSPDQIFEKYNKKHGTSYGGDKELSKAADKEIREWNTQADGTPVKIASKETMAAMRAQEPQDASKIPVTETPADKIPLSFREEPEPRVTPRTTQAYNEEYSRRYQRALAGGYNTNSRDIYQ